MGSIQTYGRVSRHMGDPNVQGEYGYTWGVQIPPMLTTPYMAATNVVEISQFKAKFLHLRNWKIIREPPDCTSNEPTPDISKGVSG